MTDTVLAGALLVEQAKAATCRMRHCHDVKHLMIVQLIDITH